MKQIIVTLVTQGLPFLFSPSIPSPPPPTHLLQDRDCSARYAQDHKIKFLMIKEEYVCNLFTIFESKKVFIQKLAFCGAFSVRPCP